MVHDISRAKPGDSGADAPGTGDQLARQQAVKQIERRRRLWFRATVGTANNKAQNQTMVLIVQGIGLLIVAIAMLGLLSAITMNIIVRTREIGVLRARRARASDERRIFGTETLTLAIIGFLLAIPLGRLLAHALQQLVLHPVNIQLPALYSLPDLGLAFIGTLVLAVLVVTGPLRRATRLRPGEATRYN